MQFDTSLEELLDSQKLIDATVREQHKDTDATTQGGLPATTRATDPNANPNGLTMYNLADILQGVPAFATDAEILSANKDSLDATVVAASGANSNEDSFGNLLNKDLLPADVRRAIDGEVPEDALATDPTAAESGTPAGQATVYPATTGDPTFDQIKTHPNVPYIDTKSVVDYAMRGQIHPNVLWTIKFLADNGLTIWWTSAYRVGAKVATGSNAGSPSLHASGRAGDIRSRGGSNAINQTKQDIDWVRRVFALLDSVTGPRRASEIGGPFDLLPNGVKNDDKGTSWFNRDDHLNHVHFGFKNVPPVTAPQP
jgi:hypothetical protein